MVIPSSKGISHKIVDTSNVSEPGAHFQLGSVPLLNWMTLGPGDKITLIPKNGVIYKEYGVERM